MSWWQGLDRLKGRFATGGVPSPEQANPEHPSRDQQPPTPMVTGESASTDAWSDLPPLQRTLADPILPVAINNRFRDSLASFSDPSFLAPLSHHVDPSVGGLVDDLVSRGEPRSHGGPELVVRVPAARQAQPRVQRLASWTSPGDDLQTVPLEYRDQAVDGQPLLPAEEGGSGVAAPALAVPSGPAPVATHSPAPLVTQPLVQRTAARVENPPATAEPSPPPAVPEGPESPAVSPDTPTLGTGTAPSPVFRLAEPLVAAAPVDHVQRIRYEPVESQRPRRGPRNDPAKGSEALATPAPAVQRTSQPQRSTQGSTLPPQRERPSQGGSHPVLGPSRPTGAPQSPPATTVGAEARGIPDPEGRPAPEPDWAGSAVDLPDTQVSRLADAVPLLPAGESGFIEAPLVGAWNPTAPPAAVDMPGHRDRASAGGPTVARLAGGATNGDSGPAARVAAPIHAVQRRAADQAGPELPVQTGHAEAPAGSLPQPPLVIARSPASLHPRDAGTPVVQGMSFERMFSGAGPSAAPTDAAEERASVQREAVAAAAAAMPSVQADSGDTAVPVATSAPGPAAAEGAGGAAGNLDEMARRLYEPLAARLREELWLDRERAGLMNDG